MLEEFPLPESHREGFIEVPIGKSSDQQSGGFLLKTCVGAAILFVYSLCSAWSSVAKVLSGHA